MQKRLLSSLLMASALTQSGFAMDMVASNSGYYYKMGGGSDVSMPPVTDQQDITLGGDVNSDLGFTCDGFNPSISIGNTLNNIAGSLQGISSSIIGSATSAVGSMPMYLLSKSNKDLYNLLQNTMTDASDTFHLSTKSCQDALGQIKNGKSPYQDWFSVSDSQGWLSEAKRAQQGQDVDINQVKKGNTQDPAKYGIPWVHKGQNSGGTNGNQVPIKVIYDVVVAGYNSMVDPSLPLDDKMTQASSGTGLSRYWKTADDAGNWARLVLGDITISSQANADQTDRGIGLMTLVQTCPNYASNNLTCAKTIASNLNDILSSNSAPSAEQLQSISSNELMATPDLINGIKLHNKQDQALAVSKWSQDVALQNTVDEALLMRRILIAGSQTKPVHNLKPATTAVNHAINQLNTDIKNILFQFQVRRALMTNTAETIMGTQQNREASAVAEHNTEQAPPMTKGAVYKDAKNTRSSTL